MKKMFKFLVCAAVVIAGFTACSEEVTPVPDPDGPIQSVEPEGELTNATFNFQLSGSASTRTVYADGNENKNVSDFRVLIFNAIDNTLEVDTVRSLSTDPDSLLTISLVSGSKRIFVYANGGINGSAPFTSPGYASVPATGSVTVANFNGEYLLAPAGGLTPPNFYTDLPGMHSLYPKSSTEKFFYSSTVREALIGLAPGISANDSKVPGTDPVNANNYINVQLDRPVAKVSITKKVPSGNPEVASKIITMDSAGTIVTTSVQYKFWTVNVRMYPFQNYSSGQIVTPGYNPTSATDTTELKNHYARGLGKNSTNEYIEIPNSDAAHPPFYYISENNPSQKMKGNTTIAEVQAIFLPTKNHYVVLNASNPGSSVNYNESGGAFIIYPAAIDLGTASDMYLFKEAGKPGLPENTLFAGADAIKLAKKIYYHLENPSVPPNNT
ncbi:MAG: hypothetical protein LBJ60_04890, partial [Tannerellaceae bacterium]|nr:hypothetical protein [Tannerellaceae bacterium]